MQRTLRARVIGALGVVALTAGLLVALTGVAVADSASDDRATFHDAANVTTCEGAGFGDSTQMPDPTSASSDADANVSAVVSTNSGPVQPGQGQEVDVTIINPLVVVDAVVVKGGNGYNVYEDSNVLPPALQPLQHYISPLNNGGNVPAISHYFVCYHLGEVPLTGSLEISKFVVPPVDGTAVVPTSFDVHVSCDSGEFDRTIAVGAPATITGLPDGDICVVEETSVLPVGSAAPLYDPATANTDGVEIVAGGTPVTVQITNDFSEVAGETVTKPPAEVVPAAAVAAAPAFTG